MCAFQTHSSLQGFLFLLLYRNFAQIYSPFGSVVDKGKFGSIFVLSEHKQESVCALLHTHTDSSGSVYMVCFSLLFLLLFCAARFDAHPFFLQRHAPARNLGWCFHQNIQAAELLFCGLCFYPPCLSLPLPLRICCNRWVTLHVSTTLR